VVSAPLQRLAVILVTTTLGGGLFNPPTRAADPPERLRPFTPFSRLEWPATLTGQTNTDVGDLELVRLHRPPDTLSLATAQSFIYTDNAYETKEQRRDSEGWVGLFGVSYVPYSTVRWTPRIVFQQSLVRFGRESAADYDSQSLAFLSSIELEAAPAFSWHCGLTLSRFYGRAGGGGEFYRYLAIDNSLLWHHALDARRQWHFFGAYSLGWRNTAPIYLGRIENALNLALVYQPDARFSVAAHLRPAVFSYPHDSPLDKNRRDFNLNTGVAASWTPFPQVALTAGFSWTGDYSSSNVRGYEESLPGVSLTARFGF
jgi:hypothetical protein